MKKGTNLLEGSIWKGIVSFAIPLFLGNLFQQLYNTADSLIVGNFLGSDALAAVSSSGSLIFLMVGFFNGIAVGAGVVISKYFGAADYDGLKKACLLYTSNRDLSWKSCGCNPRFDGDRIDRPSGQAGCIFRSSVRI